MITNWGGWVDDRTRMIANWSGQVTLL